MMYFKNCIFLIAICGITLATTIQTVYVADNKSVFFVARTNDTIKVANATIINATATTINATATTINATTTKIDATTTSDGYEILNNSASLSDTAVTWQESFVESVEADSEEDDSEEDDSEEMVDSVCEDEYLDGFLWQQSPNRSITRAIGQRFVSSPPCYNIDGLLVDRECHNNTWSDLKADECKSYLNSDIFARACPESAIIEIMSTGRSVCLEISKGPEEFRLERNIREQLHPSAVHHLQLKNISSVWSPSIVVDTDRIFTCDLRKCTYVLMSVDYFYESKKNKCVATDLNTGATTLVDCNSKMYSVRQYDVVAMSNFSCPENSVALIRNTYYCIEFDGQKSTGNGGGGVGGSDDIHSYREMIPKSNENGGVGGYEEMLQVYSAAKGMLSLAWPNNISNSEIANEWISPLLVLDVQNNDDVGGDSNLELVCYNCANLYRFDNDSLGFECFTTNKRGQPVPVQQVDRIGETRWRIRYDLEGFGYRFYWCTGISLFKFEIIKSEEVEIGWLPDTRFTAVDFLMNINISNHKNTTLTAANNVITEANLAATYNFITDVMNTDKYLFHNAEVIFAGGIDENIAAFLVSKVIERGKKEEFIGYIDGIAPNEYKNCSRLSFFNTTSSWIYYKYKHSPVDHDSKSQYLSSQSSIPLLIEAIDKLILANTEFTRDMLQSVDNVLTKLARKQKFDNTGLSMFNGRFIDVYLLNPQVDNRSGLAIRRDRICCNMPIVLARNISQREFDGLEKRWDVIFKFLQFSALDTTTSSSPPPIIILQLYNADVNITLFETKRLTDDVVHLHQIRSTTTLPSSMSCTSSWFIILVIFVIIAMYMSSTTNGGHHHHHLLILNIFNFMQICTSCTELRIYLPETCVWTRFVVLIQMAYMNSFIVQQFLGNVFLQGYLCVVICVITMIDEIYSFVVELSIISLFCLTIPLIWMKRNEKLNLDRACTLSMYFLNLTIGYTWAMYYFLGRSDALPWTLTVNTFSIALVCATNWYLTLKKNRERAQSNAMKKHLDEEKIKSRADEEQKMMVLPVSDDEEP
jgi:hypothetical protein